MKALGTPLGRTLVAAILLASPILPGTPGLSGLAGCASTEPDLGIEAFVKEKNGRHWLIVRGSDGREISAVQFDPRTGQEFFETQRLFGFTTDELLEMAGEGRRSQIPRDCFRAARVYQGHVAQYLKTPQERRVLRRQSEVLAVCLDLIGHDSEGHGRFAEKHSDGCTFVPDFDFRSCCVRHDACYAEGGSSADRLRCDVALRECIERKGHPILARLYFAGVRAFGGAGFDER